MELPKIGNLNKANLNDAKNIELLSLPANPNTTIYFCQVPFDNSYNDVVRFASASAQQSYFTSTSSVSSLTMSNCKFVTWGFEMRIVADKSPGYYNNVNYVAIQNNDDIVTWTYAFIKRVEAVSLNSTIIYCELDVYQTYRLTCTMRQSFVEREHVSNDAIGANIVPENLEIGEYVLNSQAKTGHLGTPVIIIAATVNVFGDDQRGGFYGQIYSGLIFNVCLNADEANNMIDILVARNELDAIVAVFMMSSDFVTERQTASRSYQLTFNKNTSNINGYQVKNKKLFTYPYNFMYVTNLQGNSANYRYENWSTATCGFYMLGDMSCNPEVFVAPQYYKNSGNVINLNEKISLNGFPQCAFVSDSFKAWLAQNGSSTVVSTIASAASFVGGVATANPALAGGGALGLATTIGKITDESVKPPQANGTPGSSVMYAGTHHDIYFHNATIKSDRAAIIDDYWNRYGYAVDDVKTPNESGRPYWNYVKTRACVIVGYCNNDYLTKLKSIYDKGVTIWHNPSNVGNYSLDNSI